eukprot:jgi/Astpho2/8022/Aster-02975
MLDDRVRLKRRRNPHLPKRPISAYAAYLRHARSEALAKSDDKNPREVLKELAKMWRGLSDGAKQPFVQIAQKDKERYKQEMTTYTDGIPRHLLQHVAMRDKYSSVTIMMITSNENCSLDLKIASHDVHQKKMPVICKKCKKKRANFGLKGEKPSCCAGCKVDGMQDVTNKKCEVCHKKEPYFGNEGGRARRCSDCKLDGMQDVRSRKCEACKKKHAIFGLPGGKATRCAGCKTIGMQDVKNSKCEACKKKHAVFGLPGRKATRCTGCKIVGMQNKKSKMCEGCKQKCPKFGLPGGTATRCADCRSEDMRDLYSRRCMTEGCDVRVRDAQYCANCDTSRKRRTRVKENRLANFLRENISVPWTAWNKQLPGSRECGGSKRPDFVWLLPYLAIVTECDENQHEDRCLPGERQRMFDIFNTYGGIHIIYLRFNPDAFKVDGVTRRVSMERRYAELKKVLDRELARTLEEVDALPIFRVTYLFHDVTDNKYKREMFVPKEDYEKAMWNEKLIE